MHAFGNNAVSIEGYCLWKFIVSSFKKTEIRFSHAVESYKLLLISITTRGKTNSVNER
jgi:hypothetical protein